MEASEVIDYYLKELENAIFAKSIIFDHLRGTATSKEPNMPTAPICHDNCAWVQQDRAPDSMNWYGYCECGQHWERSPAGELKAISRIKYAAISTEIAAKIEAEKAERHAQAETILGPDVADALFEEPCIYGAPP